MGADFLAVDPHGRIPVDAAKVQEKTSPGPGRWNRKRAAVPYSVGGAHHARERRFDGKWHKDLLRQLAADRRRRVALGDGELPQAVEILPVAADHLRSWVFRPDAIGTHLLGEPRHERTGGRLPFVGNCGPATRHHDE